MNFNYENSSEKFKPVDVTNINREASIEADLTMQQVEKINNQIEILETKIKELEFTSDKLLNLELEFKSVIQVLEKYDTTEEESSDMFGLMKLLIDNKIPSQLLELKSEIIKKKMVVKDLLEKSIEKKN